jgi:hypothetical protein
MLIGLDLNATRARAVCGPTAQVASPLSLEGADLELPVAVSLEERVPAVGRPGAALSRRQPDLACLDFLPQLGGARVWSARRLRIDAAGALALVFDCLGRAFGKATGIAVALPPYLSEEQEVLLARIAERARWRLLGAVPTPVAAALAAQEQLPWSGLALVLDVDGHALSWSAVDVGAEQVRLVQTQTVPQLARGVWLRRLLDGVSQRCIRLSRRDPRESAETEQALYDQLAVAIERPTGDLLDLVVQASQWYQHLRFHPDELAALCVPLVRQALAEMQNFLAATAGQGAVSALLLTAPAASLPGLAAALEDQLQAPAVARLPDPGAEADFGDDLLTDDRVMAHRAHVLDADAVARAAHAVALRMNRGELPRDRLIEVPLPPAADGADRGPARLHFRGEDYPLSRPTFTLGRDPACDLVFESELYPTVSARHCEIVFDRHTYTLRDRSRHGTLVNDRPVNQQVALHSGDWIQLGPSGPVLRFLGRNTDRPRLMPTA